MGFPLFVPQTAVSFTAAYSLKSEKDWPKKDFTKL